MIRIIGNIVLILVPLVLTAASALFIWAKFVKFLPKSEHLNVDTFIILSVSEVLDYRDFLIDSLGPPLAMADLTNLFDLLGMLKLYYW